MAIGDRVPTELISGQLTTTAGDTTFANAGASYRTEVTSIAITGQVAATTLREITIYKGGTAVANERYNIDIDPTGTLAGKTVVIQNPFVLTGTQAIYVKQDTGTDVNVEVSGIVEQIA